MGTIIYIIFLQRQRHNSLLLKNHQSSSLSPAIIPYSHDLKVTSRLHPFFAAQHDKQTSSQLPTTFRYAWNHISNHGMDNMQLISSPAHINYNSVLFSCKAVENRYWIEFVKHCHHWVHDITYTHMVLKYEPSHELSTLFKLWCIVPSQPFI